MDKLGMKTKDISKEKFEILKELFPNAVTETVSENKIGGTVNQVSRTIDIDVLRQEINGNVIEGKEERYEFTWPEKKKAIIEANSPINKTLRPIREESVNFDTTENLYIEGDNLEALKLLRETYLGKIKMIYIDPPYNTGSDFIYNDDFSQSEEEYKEISGNYDEDGNRLFKNTESNGRFHTDWLNMIYPRLKLARDLLTDDGVIFISIDDNEQANLKKVCDEIFGNSNVKGVFTWRKTHTQTNIGDFARVKEYILCYSKNIKKIFFNKIPLTNLSEYRYIDDKGNKFRRINLIDNTRGRYEYSITNFDGKNISGKWMKPKEEIEKMIKNKEVYWAGQTPYGKNYLSKMLEKGQIANDFLGIDYGTNQRSTMKLDKLMEGRIFDFSKPIELLKHFLILGSHPNSIILDFFSGSATTAHAVMQLNAEDGGNRKYIMVQLPDPDEIDKKSDAYKEGYKNICEIGKERIRRASKKLKEENPNSNFDDGFRVLRIDSSNMEDVYYKPEEFTQENLKMFESNIKKDRSGEDLLFQVMLDLGIELSNKIKEKFIQNNKIYDVGENFLIACFDENITEEVVTEIAKLKPFFAIFKEGNNLTDNTLINFEEIFKTYSPDTKRRVL
ncbi:site-specific DNA-methyltransferase [Fusobacterium polymorphum]|uniref:site-specific DNA-methyltransferase n=1 Tax=Fusobacterium nucleatum subsp. polymorphum TaxID=76857 RepID=UPI00300AE8C5